MIECPHGTPIEEARQGLCPPCSANNAPVVPLAEPMVIYRRATAMYATACGLDCGRRVHEGDSIVLVGPDHDSAVWTHEACGEDVL